MAHQEKIKTVLNWSSGKDAALAYHLLQAGGVHHVTDLLTTINAEQDRVVMHGVREELLHAQAARMPVKLNKIQLPPSPSDEVYKSAMVDALTTLKQNDITTAAFGDIFLEDLKTYREQQLASIGFDAAFPLWKKDTRELISLLEQTGMEAMIVCVNGNKLGKEFLGRRVNAALLQDMPADVDPCGEHGEFHTFVYNAPYFSSPIKIAIGETVYFKFVPV